MILEHKELGIALFSWKIPTFLHYMFPVHEQWFLPKIYLLEKDCQALDCFFNWKKKKKIYSIYSLLQVSQYPWTVGFWEKMKEIAFSAWGLKQES